MNENRNRAAVVLLILAAGFFLRVYGLGRESIWLDEGYTLWFARFDLLHVLLNQENNPPLYFLLMHWWVMLFGGSEFSLRLPSVIFGCLSIIMIYRVGKQLYGHEEGLLAGFLLCVSAFHIAFSREARTFSLTLLLSLLSVHFFIKLLRRETDAGTLSGYILFSLLLMYSHIYGLFIIMFENLFVLNSFFLPGGRCRIKPLNWILAQAVLLVLFCAWVPIFLDRIRFVKAGFWLKMPDIGIIGKTIAAYCNNSHFLEVLYILLAGIAVIGGPFLKRSYSSNAARADGMGSDSVGEFFSEGRKSSFLLLWFLVPIIFPFIVSRFITPIYHIKYTIVALPAFYLLVAGAITFFKNRFLKIAVVVCIAGFSIQPVCWYLTTVQKAQWREAVQYIDAHAQPEDLIIFNSFICKDLLFNYYSGRQDLKARNDMVNRDVAERYRDNVDRTYIDDLMKMAGGHDRVWVVLSTSGRNRDRIRQALLHQYRISWQKQYVGIKVYLFVKEKEYKSRSSPGYY